MHMCATVLPCSHAYPLLADWKGLNAIYFTSRKQSVARPRHLIDDLKRRLFEMSLAFPKARANVNHLLGLIASHR